MTTEKKSKKNCGNCGCKLENKTPTNTQNGKGDCPRPSKKQKYNKNYEFINWSTKK